MEEEKKIQFQCSGDCLNCRPANERKVQWQYCAAQFTYNSMRMLQSMQESIGILGKGIEELEENLQDSEQPAEFEEEEMVHDFDKVFIVHGHDGELKQKVARLLEKQGIEAVILSEQPNQGMTIIEKIEAYSEGVDAAICLFTPDDEMKDGTKRARENVVLETGYFIGKIGREKTIVIVADGVMNLSDLKGIVYVSDKNWELDVLKELREIGYSVDFNKL